MFDLTGKGALVTGATGGIGGAIAKALHGQGASVAISGTKAEKLDTIAAELGTRVFALPCDLRGRFIGGRIDRSVRESGGNRCRRAFVLWRQRHAAGQRQRERQRGGSEGESFDHIFSSTAGAALSSCAYFLR